MQNTTASASDGESLLLLDNIVEKLQENSILLDRLKASTTSRMRHPLNSAINNADEKTKMENNVFKRMREYADETESLKLEVKRLKCVAESAEAEIAIMKEALERTRGESIKFEIHREQEKIIENLKAELAAAQVEQNKIERQRIEINSKLNASEERYQIFSQSEARLIEEKVSHQFDEKLAQVRAQSAREKQKLHDQLSQAASREDCLESELSAVKCAYDSKIFVLEQELLVLKISLDEKVNIEKKVKVLERELDDRMFDSMIVSNQLKVLTEEVENLRQQAAQR